MMGSKDFLQQPSEEGFQAGEGTRGGFGGGRGGRGGFGGGRGGRGGTTDKRRREIGSNGSEGSKGSEESDATDDLSLSLPPLGEYGCTSVQTAIIESDSAFFEWHSAKSEMLNDYIQQKAHSPTDMKDIVLLARDIDSINNCLTSKIQASSSTANEIFLMQEQVLSLQEQIAREAENTQIAKDRLAYSQEPVKYSSYYSSWFPATRPLYYVTVVALLSFSLFVGIFGLLFILSLVGVDLSFFKNNMYDSRLQYGMTYASQFTTPFWIAVAAAVALLIYILVRR